MNFHHLLGAPLWLQILIVGAAAWSTFQLLAFDKILDKPRHKVLKLGEEWEKQGDPVPDDYRLETAQFLTCPYCAGFWIWVLWLLAWFLTSWTLVPGLLLGGRAMVVAGHKLLAKDEDK